MQLPYDPTIALLEIYTREMKTWVNPKTIHRDFPCGAAVKNLPANAGDTGLSPGLGRSHVPWSN